MEAWQGQLSLTTPSGSSSGESVEERFNMQFKPYWGLTATPPS